MPFNGSGNFAPVPPPAFPAIAGDVITAAYFNQIILDITSNGLTNTITRDGQGKPTANQNWDGFNLTNVGDFTCATCLIGGVIPWTPANDGAGSGLDADLLDGQHGAYYLAVTAYNAATTFAQVLTLDGAGSGLDADLFHGTAYSAFAQLASANFTVLQVGSKSVGYLELPQDGKAAGFTLALAEAGGHVYYTGAAANATVPTNASVAFPVGSAVTLVNNGSGALAVVRAGGVTMKWAGTGANADRSLAIGGLATLLKVATDTWFISGPGLS